MGLYSASALEAFTAALLGAAGLAEGPVASVARSLMRADLMGHTTHGLALLPWYLEVVAAGQVTTAGPHEVVKDTGSCVTWNGRGLPVACRLAVRRLSKQPSATRCGPCACAGRKGSRHARASRATGVATPAELAASLAAAAAAHQLVWPESNRQE